MKKLAATLTACACLGLSTISASAASTETSGGIELDSIVNDYSEEGSDVVKKRSKRGASTGWKNADGGSFRVLWEGNTHSSQFDHGYKNHGVSASNSHSTEYSKIKSPGARAEVSIYSTHGGNRGNWTTDNWS